MFKKAIITVTALLLAIAPALADEKYGVLVYPGAVYDDDTTQYLEEDLYLEGTAYRTPESAAKVTEFYVKEGFTVEKEGKKGRVVLRKDDVEVTIQGPPRKDQTSGKKMEDTLITITKPD